jgi:hypothetical protein
VSGDLSHLNDYLDHMRLAATDAYSFVAPFNPDSSLAIAALQNQWVVGRVLTRHVGLKPDLHPNELFGFNLPSATAREK